MPPGRQSTGGLSSWLCYALSLMQYTAPYALRPPVDEAKIQPRCLEPRQRKPRAKAVPLRDDRWPYEAASTPLAPEGGPSGPLRLSDFLWQSDISPTER